MMTILAKRDYDINYICAFYKRNYHNFVISKGLREPISRMKSAINSMHDLSHFEKFSNSDIIRVVIKLREQNREIFDAIVKEIIKEKKIKLASKRKARKKKKKRLRI